MIKNEKKIKTFEKFKEKDIDIDNLPIGTYVITKIHLDDLPDGYFENYIGEIIEKNVPLDDPGNFAPYLVEYEDYGSLYLWGDDILYFSKNKKDLEIILDTKKYSL